MADKIGDIIQATLDFLQIEFPDKTIESFPDDPGEYQLTNIKGGAVLIRYDGSKFREGKNGLTPPKGREIRLIFVIIMMSIQGEGGLYEEVDKLLETLRGFEPLPGKPLYPVLDRFLSEEGNFWQHGIIFKMNADIL